jgi:hypothetical protein
MVDKLAPSLVVACLQADVIKLLGIPVASVFCFWYQPKPSAHLLMRPRELNIYLCSCHKYPWQLELKHTARTGH